MFGVGRESTYQRPISPCFKHRKLIDNSFKILKKIILLSNRHIQKLKESAIRIETGYFCGARNGKKKYQKIAEDLNLQKYLNH